MVDNLFVFFLWVNIWNLVNIEIANNFILDNFSSKNGPSLWREVCFKFFIRQLLIDNLQWFLDSIRIWFLTQTQFWVKFWFCYVFWFRINFQIKTCIGVVVYFCLIFEFILITTPILSGFFSHNLQQAWHEIEMKFV